MKFILVAEFVGATASGAVVGLVEHGVGWGLVGFMIFGLVAVVVGTVMVAVASGGRNARNLVYGTHHGRPTGQSGDAGPGCSS